MKEIYKKIWELAKPYYQKGRPMDIGHIEWMMQDADTICKVENIDDSLLMPLVILHDVGYGVGKHAYFEKELKKKHMIDGAKIARKILEKLEYNEEKIKKIEYYISVHDYWIFDKNYVYDENPILAVFTDLDYMWMATHKGFPIIRKILNKTEEEMLEFLENNEKPINRPFVTKTAKKLYTKYMNDIRKEIK